MALLLKQIELLRDILKRFLRTMTQDVQPGAIEHEAGVFRTARSGILWSIVQNWGGKLLTFGLSILLARLLTPTEFGIASAASLVLMLVPLIAEFGFGDAILQRHGLKREDLNLPFYMSMTFAAAMVALVVIFSDPIATVMEVPSLSLYIVAIAATIVINAPSAFQEAMYKRHLKFRTLALRTFVTSIFGGGFAVIFAWYGFGIWSFIVSAYVSSIINLIWLWWIPEWKPSLKIDLPAFKQMLRFGAPVVAQRLQDFFSSRLVDILIISQFNLAFYGIYVVGSRLYQTMMQMLQGAFYDVSLTILSTIAHDNKRISEVYLKTVGLAATFITPVFVLVAALSPEICLVLYGDRWAGVDVVATILLLLGALQCVQYMNGPFLSALGKPELVFVAGISKAIGTIALLLLIPGDDLQDLTTLFALGQLFATPLTFYFVVAQLKLKVTDLLRALAPSLLNGALSFLAVIYSRPLLDRAFDLNAFWQGVLLGIVYSTSWVVLLALFDRSRLTTMVSTIAKKFESAVLTA